jgi:Zn-dependent peptidase ImmA (M78 family)
MEKARAASHWTPNRKVLSCAPAVAEFDTPALMFGGLNVDFRESDVQCLYNLLVQQRNRVEGQSLSPLVSTPSIYEFIQPYAHGYELAYETRDKLGIDHHKAFVDIEEILTHLGITIQDATLQTGSVRGVAIAGAGLSPAILVNTTNKFNASKGGRRFTLAHELCHILFDRSSAKRLSHVSGPWASVRVERRANAFAAMFLATPHALSKARGSGEIGSQIKHLSEKFGVGIRALREHMHNLDLLSDEEFVLSGDGRH